MADMKVTADDIERELCRRSLKYFTQRAFKIVDPGRPFVDNWHIEEICRHLEACNTKEIKKLIVNQPPGTMKSLLVSVMFPAWVWTFNPGARFLYVGYNTIFMKQPHNKFKQVCESEWYQRLWGDMWRQDTWDALKCTNTARGQREAVSIKGGALGKHYDYIFVDDPIKPQDLTPGAIEEVNEFFGTAISNRTFKADDLCLGVVMQRLDVNDLSGYLIEKDKSFVHLCLPMHFKPGKWTQNVLGVYDRRTQPEESLWPEIKSPAFIEEQKNLLNIHYNAHYEQDPTPMGGGLFKRDWIKFYDVLPDAGNATFVQSWDTAFKSANSDYTVGQVWMRKGGEFYLLDQVRARMDITDICNAIRTLSAKYPKCYRKYVESAASGKDVISVLRKEIPGILGIPVKDGKYQRANSICGLWASGNIYLPSPKRAPWIHDFIQELCAFTGKPTDTDDQVDSMSQALIQLYSTDYSVAAATLRKIYW